MAEALDLSRGTSGSKLGQAGARVTCSESHRVTYRRTRVGSPTPRGFEGAFLTSANIH